MVNILAITCSFYKIFSDLVKLTCLKWLMGTFFLIIVLLTRRELAKRLGRLCRLVLWTLPSIVTLLATLKTSARHVPLSRTRQNLLSLRLLHLLSRCTILSGRCLVSLLSLARQLSTRRVIGHPPHNLSLLSLWVTRRSSDHPLALPRSLRITLKSLHSNGCIHQSTKSLISPVYSSFCKMQERP